VPVSFHPAALKQTRWYEYLIRFVFGGIITAGAGIIAKEFGPTIGGLFLAFPAIFPASATLIESHEEHKKEEQGLNGTIRGRDAVSLDAAGAAIGGIGLALFALITSSLLPKHSTAAVLALATAAWFLASVALWSIRKKA
jgi:hypothetical protein